MNTNRNNMKILYLHGLDAVPKIEKIRIIESCGHYVLAPELNYRHFENNHALFEDMKYFIINEDISYIVGSSFGGYFGFHLAEYFNLPAILFNPAVYAQSLYVPVETKFSDSAKIIVLGINDDLVDPQMTKQWLIKNKYKKSKFLELDFGHQVPLEIFSVVKNYL